MRAVAINNVRRTRSTPEELAARKFTRVMQDREARERALAPSVTAEALKDWELGFVAPSVDPKIANILADFPSVWVALLSDLVRCTHEGEEQTLKAARNLASATERFAGIMREEARLGRFKARSFPDFEATH